MAASRTFTGAPRVRATIQRHRTRWRAFVGSAIVMLVAGALALGPAAARSDPPPDRPTLTGSIEALMLWRSGLADRPLFFGGPPPDAGLNASDVATGMAAGPRYRIDWSPGGEGALEFNYFKVESFSGSRGLTAAVGNLEQAEIFGFSFPDVAAAAAAASSGITSFEVNRRLPLGGIEGDFLYGFRWVEWNDGLAVADRTVTGSQSGRDLFLAKTIDSLYGAQLGLDAVVAGSRSGRSWVEGVGKAGIYYDRAVQHSLVDSVSTDQVIRSTAATADLTSFFGELGFTGCLRLSDHWVARTGFTMFWLGNVTDAASQFSANNLFSDEIQSGIDTGASVFLYGINLGLEAAW